MLAIQSQLVMNGQQCNINLADIHGALIVIISVYLHQIIGLAVKFMQLKECV